MRIKYSLIAVFTSFLFFSFFPKVSFAQDIIENDANTNIELQNVKIEVNVLSENDVNDNQELIEPELQSETENNELIDTNDPESAVNEIKEFTEEIQHDNKTNNNVSEIEDVVEEATETEQESFENELESELVEEITEIENIESITLTENVMTKTQLSLKQNEIVQLKKNLTQLGFGRFPANPSGNFGPVTEGVLRDFQEYFKLPITGQPDQATLKKIDQLLSIPKTMPGNKVKELKQDLRALGFGKFPKNPSENYADVTKRVVSEFQEYYNLRKSGLADEITLAKIKEVLEPPYKNGDRGQAIVKLKKNLREIGFGNFPKNPSINYGIVTEGVVKEFQTFFGLNVNGIADKEVLNLIDQIIKNPFKNGSSGEHVTQLKKHLTKLGFGKFPKNPSINYGKVTANVVKEFQHYYSLSNKSGIADRGTIKKINEILNSPYQNGKTGPHVRQLKLDLKRLGFGKFPSNPSENYGDVTERVVKEFQSAYNLKINGIFDSVSMNTLKRELNALSKRIKIFIDPGHGGSDPGATSNGHQEKNFNLQIAKEIEKYLKQYKNVEIKLSRTNDTYLSLSDRTKMANDWGADYYVSVHINAGGGTGFESYIFNNPTKDEIEKQKIIHDHIANNISERDRGKKQANFHVLRESKMSAILFEFLFIDNTSDRNKLLDNNYIKKLGRLTAEGIAYAFNLRK